MFHVKHRALTFYNAGGEIPIRLLSEPLPLRQGKRPPQAEDGAGGLSCKAINPNKKAVKARLFMLFS